MDSRNQTDAWNDVRGCLAMTPKDSRYIHTILEFLVLAHRSVLPVVWLKAELYF